MKEKIKKLNMIQTFKKIQLESFSHDYHNSDDNSFI